MSWRQNFRFFKVFGVVILLMLSAFLVLLVNVGSVHINKDVNDKSEVTIDFDRPGIDATSMAVRVPLNATILSATVDVQASTYEGEYPSDIKVNVGNDEDNEWMFSGKGYGSLGKQTLFTNGQDKQFLYFNNVNYINSPRIMIPRNASVISSSMVIEGGTGMYDEDYFATVDYYGYQLSYMRSNGDGTFTSPTNVATNVGMYLRGAVGIGDFDNDGDLDIVSGGSSGNIYFYEKTSTGNSFKSGKLVGSVSTTWYTYDFAVGDFTNDGNYDFVTSGSNLELFTGDGKGGFTSSQISGGPSTVYGKDAADINNDGNLDLVCGGTTAYSIYYFPGNGDGTFQQPVKINSPSTYYIYSVITDDFNGDGNVDILACYYYGPYYYFEGYGNGTFKSPTSSEANPGTYPDGDAYDYNMDGKVDLVLTNYASTSQASFYSGDGDGTFTYGNNIGNVGRYYCGGAAPPPKVLGANNTKLYIGDVSGSPADWSFGGRLAGVIEHVDDFSPKLNALLASSKSSSYTDNFNNEFVYIPLNFTSTDDGLVRISSFSIEYEYTATIDRKDRSNLAEEMNDHIIFTGGDTVDIHFIVSVGTPGSVKFSNISIIYNIPPDHKENIPTLHVYEDVENLNLLDLSTFFTDTDEPSLNLNYSVFKNSQSDHVDVFTNYTNILRFKPITENWYGSTDIIVQATDSGKKKTYSNQFTIVVHQVNDEPYAEVPLPDITLVEGEQDKELDLELREYFSDIEDDYLYYKIEIDPRGFLPDPEDKEIKVIKNDDNILQISGIGDFNSYVGDLNQPIPVWIYCDDDQEVNTYSDGDYTYQEILVTVLPVNDKPIWRTIPKFTFLEDETDTFSDFVNIYNYITDDETSQADMKYDFTTTNPTIILTRDGGMLSIDTPENYYGEGIITITATDEKGTLSAVTFGIEILPRNDEPTITINSHQEKQTVSGTITIGGKMFDVEGTIKLVEIKIESQGTDELDGEWFDWQRANMRLAVNNWSYIWDTTIVPDGFYLITAQVYDGELTNLDTVELQIENGQNFEPIVEISYPAEDNTVVNGTVVISGTVQDPDMQGISDLQIRIGADMDWTKIPLQSENQTVWLYEWDTLTFADQEYNILVKAYDGFIWSIPASKIVVVHNNQTLDVGGETDTETQDDPIWTIASILIIVVIILGILIVFGLVTRANKKVREYVPDGRMEPLDNLEAMVKPALGPGVSIEHAPLPAATPAQVPGLPPVQPASPYGGAAAAPAPLPAAGAVQSPDGTQAKLPALPAAKTVNVTPTEQQNK
jgi:hypothetical protein